MKTDFVKAILYVYPTMKALAEAIRVSAENKAVLSYRSRRDAMSDLEEVAEEIFLAERVDELKEIIDGVLALLNEEELLLLEYRYFRRKKILKRLDGQLACSERSYFRKQERLLRKLLAYLAAQGVTEEYFFEAFGNSLCFMKVYKAVANGGELKVCARRGKRTIAFQPSKVSVGTDFLPCATNTATTRTATADRVIKTIWTADRAPTALPLAVAVSGSGR